MNRWLPTNGRRALVTALTAFTLAVPLVIAGPVANAAGTAHHVDCTAATNGTGTEAAPLNSLVAANAVTLEAGDSLLIKRGTTCQGQLAPAGSGSDG